MHAPDAFVVGQSEPSTKRSSYSRAEPIPNSAGSSTTSGAKLYYTRINQSIEGDDSTQQTDHVTPSSEKSSGFTRDLTYVDSNN